MVWKYVPVAATFNKSGYRCEHLNTVPSCVSAPKHLPKILFIILKRIEKHKNTSLNSLET